MPVARWAPSTLQLGHGPLQLVHPQRHRRLFRLEHPDLPGGAGGLRGQEVNAELERRPLRRHALGGKRGVAARLEVDDFDRGAVPAGAVGKDEVQPPVDPQASGTRRPAPSPPRAGGASTAPNRAPRQSHRPRPGSRGRRDRRPGGTNPSSGSCGPAPRAASPARRRGASPRRPAPAGRRNSPRPARPATPRPGPDGPRSPTAFLRARANGRHSTRATRRTASNQIRAGSSMPRSIWLAESRCGVFRPDGSPRKYSSKGWAGSRRPFQTASQSCGGRPASAAAGRAAASRSKAKVPAAPSAPSDLHPEHPLQERVGPEAKLRTLLVKKRRAEDDAARRCPGRWRNRAGARAPCGQVAGRQPEREPAASD